MQEQKTTIIDIVMQSSNDARYRLAQPGKISRPRHLSAGFWLQMDVLPLAQCAKMIAFGFESVLWKQLGSRADDAILPEPGEYQTHKGKQFWPAMEMGCNFNSPHKHVVKKSGFILTHAYYLTTTASEIQTLRTRVTIDCARLEGATGRNNDKRWLNPYVMSSRATEMSDLFLLRPPPRKILKRGPPSNVKKQLERLETRMAASINRTEATAKSSGFEITA